MPPAFRHLSHHLGATDPFNKLMKTPPDKNVYIFKFLQKTSQVHKSIQVLLEGARKPCFSVDLKHYCYSGILVVNDFHKEMNGNDINQNTKSLLKCYHP